jgi:hypothetical protein
MPAHFISKQHDTATANAIAAYIGPIRVYPPRATRTR